MELKSQDTLLALKYWSMKQMGQESSVRELAEQIGISASEVSKGAKRLLASRLIVEREGRFFAESGALFEWLGYGIRYAYPVERIGYGRGMATSWNCPLLKTEIVPPSPPIVWPLAGGDIEGAYLKPIHDSVPFAASHDSYLYKAMALVEAVREGKPRELVIAREQLAHLIKGQS